MKTKERLQNKGYKVTQKGKRLVVEVGDMSDVSDVSSIARKNTKAHVGWCKGKVIIYE